MPGAKSNTLRNTIVNPLARMLPLLKLQDQVYRLGEKLPPSGGLDGHGPTWVPVTFTLEPRGTSQAQVSLQRDFTLLGMTCESSSIVNGGFRAQLYDVKKKLRFAGRGVLQACIAGNLAPGVGAAPGGPIFLREPYAFDLPDSQVLVLVQNLETVMNNIQIVLYGVAMRFNAPSASRSEFPGGNVSSVWGG